MFLEVVHDDLTARGHATLAVGDGLHSLLEASLEHQGTEHQVFLSSGTCADEASVELHADNLRHGLDVVRGREQSHLRLEVVRLIWNFSAY